MVKVAADDSPDKPFNPRRMFARTRIALPDAGNGTHLRRAHRRANNQEAEQIGAPPMRGEKGPHCTAVPDALLSFTADRLFRSVPFADRRGAAAKEAKRISLHIGPAADEQPEGIARQKGAARPHV